MGRLPQQSPPYPEEKKYTLNEAKAELDRQECNLNGHDFDIIVFNFSLDPQEIICQRCNKKWRVA